MGLVSLLEEIGAEHDKCSAEVSIARAWRYLRVAAASVERRGADQVGDTIGAAKFRLGEDEIEREEDFILENS
ncbi:MAG: hypothetical protein ACFB50_19130 [Rubrobacteraceae bacterium]